MLNILFTAVALFLLPAPASAEIYKCRLSNGKIEISSAPCPSGGAVTLTVRPDEPVSEASRKQAERDVERMRSYVEQREASHRAEEMAERQERNSQRQAASTSRLPQQYGNAEECLRNIEQMALEAMQRAQLEAECRSIVRPQTVYVPVPVAVPVFPPPRPRHVHPEPAPKTEPPSAPRVSMSPKK